MPVGDVHMARMDDAARNVGGGDGLRRPSSTPGWWWPIKKGSLSAIGFAARVGGEAVKKKNTKEGKEESGKKKQKKHIL